MKMNPRVSSHLQRHGLWFIILLLFAPQATYAGEKCIVGVAVNFISPMTELVEIFEQLHKVRIDVSYGSSGKLYGQVTHGAPYSLFLSADHSRPQRLHEQGICGKPFHYSSGRVVLWTKDRSIQATTWQEALIQNPGKIALASPDSAPYGEKAMQALNRGGLFKTIEPQLIYGQSVGQAFLFVQTGGAQLGFIALSQALSETGQKGRYWPVPESKGVDQWGCIPVKAPHHDIAQKLQDLLTSETGRRIGRKYGYQ